MNTNLLGLAQKDHLDEARRILVENGFTDAEADQLIADADRQIETYIQSWAAAIRRATKKGA